jgi:hypothetical protein
MMAVHCGKILPEVALRKFLAQLSPLTQRSVSRTFADFSATRKPEFQNL